MTPGIHISLQSFLCLFLSSILSLPGFLLVSPHYSKIPQKGCLYFQDSVLFLSFLDLTLVRLFSYAIELNITVTSTLQNLTVNIRSTSYMAHQQHLIQSRIFSFLELTLDSILETKSVQNWPFFQHRPSQRSYFIEYSYIFSIVYMYIDNRNFNQTILYLLFSLCEAVASFLEITEACSRYLVAFP